MAAVEETWLDVGGAALAARSWPGPGRPVLAVHGLSSNARLWDETAAALARRGHPVVAVDLRGHGRSHQVPDTAVDPTVQAAQDLAAVCAALGWEAPVVAGQSWGGNVVLQLAADRPELVHGLVLVDGGWLVLADRWATLDEAWEVLAPPQFDGLRADDLRARLREVHPSWSEAALAATANNLQVRDDGTIAPWLDRDRHRTIVGSLLAQRPRDLYPRVTCPAVLLVAGAANPAADEAAAAMPNARVVPFVGGDHDLHAQHPDRVAALVHDLA
ncbi:MAG: alpha/beta hydrolase fold protein [Frankiales bacterium]|nr:alpha/beta hydrolase fold protein [Frankiales bacterium]